MPVLVPDLTPFWNDHVLPMIRGVGNKTYFLLDAIPLPALAILAFFCAICLRYLNDSRPTSPLLSPYPLTDSKSPRSTSPRFIHPFRSPSSRARLSGPGAGAGASAGQSAGSSGHFVGLCEYTLSPIDMADTNSAPQSTGEWQGTEEGGEEEYGGVTSQRGGQSSHQNNQIRRGSGRKVSTGWRCGLGVVPERDEEAGL